MLTSRYTFIAFVVIAFLSMTAFAQNDGDYRSASPGNWSEVATWEIFDSGSWVAATDAPDGSETITILNGDSVVVDTDITVTGYITVTDTAYLSVDEDTGSLVFGDGSTYEHARDDGSVPTATWEEGSTIYLTGLVFNAPANRNQSYYNLTVEVDSMLSNLDLGLNGVTIGGDLRVLSTGVARLRLTSAATGDTSVVTIMGDVIVEAGSFETQGTGNANTGIYVHHYGSIIASGNNFSIARGSQGGGSGSTIWYLYEGDFTMSGGTTQNSNSGAAGGIAKYVFASANTQTIAFTDVTFGGGRFNFDVSDSTTLVIAEPLSVNGDIVNEGAISVGDSVLTVASGGIYEHARDGGTIPPIIWADGSTAMLTGVTSSAPAGRNQNYYNLHIGGEISSNINLNYGSGEWTIRGDITVASGGSGRWQFTNTPAAGSVTVNILGNVIQTSGNFEGSGSGNNAVTSIINVHGDIDVSGGNFSVTRGTAGGDDGTGVLTWNLYGDFSLVDATTQNSNPWRARFVFAGSETQTVYLENVNYGGGGLPIEIASGAVVDFGESVQEGNGVFILHDSGTLVTAHPDGVNGTVQTTGEVTIGNGTHFVFNGTQPQATGTAMPDTVQSLTINNDAGVTLTQETLVNGVLRLVAGVLDNTNPVTFGPSGFPSFEGGSVLVPFDQPELPLLVEDWGFLGGRVAGWNISVGDPGDVSISGDQPLTSGWSAIRGGFPFLIATDGEAFKVSGKINFVGQGPHIWNAMRYGVFRHDDVGELEHADTDSARWSGSEGSAYGYLLMTMSGTNERATWSIGGAGDIGVHRGGAWISTFSGDPTSLGVIDQRLFRAEAPEGLYDFAISVHTQDDGNNQVRFYFTHEDGEYWHGGIVIDTTGVPTSVYNGVAFAINADADDMTAVHFSEITVDVGDPITLPDPPLETPPHAVGRILNENRTFELSSPGETTGEPFWVFNRTEGGANAVFHIDTEEAQTGTRSLKIDFGTWNGTNDVWHVEAVSDPFYPAEGDIIRATVWMKADEDGRIARIYLGLPGSGGWQRVPDWGMEVICTLTTEWTQYAFPDYTVIARDVTHADESMRFGIEFNLAVNDGGMFWIDNAIVRVVDVVSVEERPDIPLVFALEQNYPNPFNPTTQIQFSLPEQSDVLLEVFDILGRRVATLINNENYTVGHHTITWDATSQTGRTLSSGMYIYRLQAGSFVQTKRMMFLK
jgi:hypothetical protein